MTLRSTAGSIVRRIPLLRTWGMKLYVHWAKNAFKSSEDYWVKRYRNNGDSGWGSYGPLAKFKAQILNDFVSQHSITSVIEYGCGDGNQLKLAQYTQYIGFDVSPQAVARCRSLFADDSTKTFLLVGDYRGETAELTISLDVVYHLVEDAVFEEYMTRLFQSALRYVIVYSSNTDEQSDIQGPHVRHRHFTQWVESNITGWTLQQQIPNQYHLSDFPGKGSLADFYIWKKSH